ncbi:ATP-binding cassette domain-containing protein [Streptococcus jiangjianxini]|uniref:ATP-binding cassette domain-containing protein n=1 Tax=Streptococcus jiangjianxini TaxID=3161189 RepID=UPI0032EF0067
MLQTQHLTLTHQKDLTDLVNNLDLVVNVGDKLAIIGEEGTGKSSLIKAIIDPTAVSDYINVEGKIINQWHHIGYLPQSLTSEQLKQSVADFLYGDIDYTTFDFSIFYRMADRFHLDVERFEDNAQTLSSLSGGEKLKIQLLKILAQDPDLLILDEPSSDLDRDSIIWLEHFIIQSDKTIIFISHDETFLENTATAILHLELLKKRSTPRASYFKGSYSDYKENRRETFERQLQRANKEREEHQERMARSHRIHQSVEHQLRHTKNGVAGRLLAKKLNTILSQEKRYGKEAEKFTEIPQDMDAINLFFSEISPLSTNKILINWVEQPLETGQTINLLVKGQDKIVITGSNGIGKTRLLKKILNELSSRTEPSLGYMPQHYDDFLNHNLSTLDFLTEVTEPEKARTLLASLQFTRDEISHSVIDLSGGQKAKLFLAKMVLAGNNVLVLDEPTRHFSPTSQPIIREILRDFPGAIISVSHDRNYIREVAQKRYQLTPEKLEQIRQ